MVPVGTLIGVIADGTADDAEIDAFIAAQHAAFVPAAEAASAPAPARVATEIGPIQVVEAGPEDAPPLVLIHGFGGDLNNWLFLQPLLAARFHTFAIDLPGHGGSTKTLPGGNFAALARAVAAFLRARGIGPAHLVGHSLGGAVALMLAPESLSLSLISPAGLGPEINMDYIGGFIAARRAREMQAVLAMLFADPALIGRDMVEGVLRYKRLDGVAAALQAIAAANFANGRQNTSLRATLAAIRVPTLVAWGAGGSHASPPPTPMRCRHRCASSASPKPATWRTWNAPPILPGTSSESPMHRKTSARDVALSGGFPGSASDAPRPGLKRYPRPWRLRFPASPRAARARHGRGR